MPTHKKYLGFLVQPAKWETVFFELARQKARLPGP